MHRKRACTSWRLVLAGVALTTSAATALFGTEGQVTDLAMAGGGALGFWHLAVWGVYLDAKRLREAG
ncbi:hypothetical protein [Mesorhizobium sp. A623]